MLHDVSLSLTKNLRTIPEHAQRRITRPAQQAANATSEVIVIDRQRLFGGRATANGAQSALARNHQVVVATGELMPLKALPRLGLPLCVIGPRFSPNFPLSYGVGKGFSVLRFLSFNGFGALLPSLVSGIFPSPVIGIAKTVFGLQALTHLTVIPEAVRSGNTAVKLASRLNLVTVRAHLRVRHHDIFGSARNAFANGVCAQFAASRDARAPRFISMEFIGRLSLLADVARVKMYSVIGHGLFSCIENVCGKARWLLAQLSGPNSIHEIVPRRGAFLWLL